MCVPLGHPLWNTLETIRKREEDEEQFVPVYEWMAARGIWHLGRSQTSCATDRGTALDQSSGNLRLPKFCCSQHTLHPQVDRRPEYKMVSDGLTHVKVRAYAHAYRMPRLISSRSSPFLPGHPFLSQGASSCFRKYGPGPHWNPR